MANDQLRGFLRRLQRTLGPGEAGALADAELLRRFAARRDEAAFEALVWRHGGMVLAVCARLLRHAEDVEDAFQAAFLALARRAGAVRRGEAVGGWLHRVAFRTALRARAARAAAPAPLSGDVPAGSDGDALLWRDLRPVLDEEIDRLPPRYRAAVIHCYLEGLSTAEAAERLGCPRGTVLSRLATARRWLRGRLTRRGVTLATLAAVPSVQAARVQATVRAGVQFAANGGASTRAAALAKGVTGTMTLTKMAVAATLLLTLTLAGTGTLLFSRRVSADPGAPDAELVAGKPTTLRLSPARVGRLGLKTAEVKARDAVPPDVLRLTGRLAVDPDLLARVYSPVTGEVTEVAKVGVGDGVKKGQVLAVVWSKDLALKKGEYVDALAQLALDEATLTGLEKLASDGAVPLARVTEACRKAAASRAAAGRAERTLVLWRLPEKELKALRAEARAPGAGKRDPQKEQRWAQVEVRAPRGGTVLERNTSIREIVETRTPLFTVADLTRLAVLAEAPEADLPALQALPPKQQRIRVRPGAAPDAKPVEGRIERLAPTVDPATGTVAIRGVVENAGGALRPGQFVRVEVPLPPGPARVRIPASALVEDGKDAVLFVQPDPNRRHYEMRRVVVVRKAGGTAIVRARAKAEGPGKGLAPVKPGERVVTAGAAELKALLEELKERGKR